VERLTETSLERYCRIEGAHFDQMMEKELTKFDELKREYTRRYHIDIDELRRQLTGLPGPPYTLAYKQSHTVHPNR